jgi:hypothetical protein
MDSSRKIGLGTVAVVTAFVAATGAFGAPEPSRAVQPNNPKCGSKEYPTFAASTTAALVAGTDDYRLAYQARPEERDDYMEPCGWKSDSAWLFRAYVEGDLRITATAAQLIDADFADEEAWNQPYPPSFRYAALRGWRASTLLMLGKSTPTEAGPPSLDLIRSGFDEWAHIVSFDWTSEQILALNIPGHVKNPPYSPKDLDLEVGNRAAAIVLGLSSAILEDEEGATVAPMGAVLTVVQDDGSALLGRSIEGWAGGAYSYMVPPDCLVALQEAYDDGAYNACMSRHAKARADDSVVFVDTPDTINESEVVARSHWLAATYGALYLERMQELRIYARDSNTTPAKKSTGSTLVDLISEHPSKVAEYYDTIAVAMQHAADSARSSRSLGHKVRSLLLGSAIGAYVLYTSTDGSVEEHLYLALTRRQREIGTAALLMAIEAKAILAWAPPQQPWRASATRGKEFKALDRSADMAVQAALGVLADLFKGKPDEVAQFSQLSDWALALETGRLRPHERADLPGVGNIGLGDATQSGHRAVPPPMSGVAEGWSALLPPGQGVSANLGPVGVLIPLWTASRCVAESQTGANEAACGEAPLSRSVTTWLQRASTASTSIGPFLTGRENPDRDLVYCRFSLQRQNHRFSTDSMSTCFSEAHAALTRATEQQDEVSKRARDTLTNLQMRSAMSSQQSAQFWKAWPAMLPTPAANRVNFDERSEAASAITGRPRWKTEALLVQSMSTIVGELSREPHPTKGVHPLIAVPALMAQSALELSGERQGHGLKPSLHPYQPNIEEERFRAIDLALQVQQRGLCAVATPRAWLMLGGLSLAQPANADDGVPCPEVVPDLHDWSAQRLRSREVSKLELAPPARLVDPSRPGAVRPDPVSPLRLIATTSHSLRGALDNKGPLDVHPVVSWSGIPEMDSLRFAQIGIADAVLAIGSAGGGFGLDGLFHDLGPSGGPATAVLWLPLPSGWYDVHHAGSGGIRIWLGGDPLIQPVVFVDEASELRRIPFGEPFPNIPMEEAP